GPLARAGAPPPTSPPLVNCPRRSRSSTRPVAAPSLQSLTNPSPARTAYRPPSPEGRGGQGVRASEEEGRRGLGVRTVHQTSLRFTSGSRISTPLRFASRPNASSE